MTNDYLDMRLRWAETSRRLAELTKKNLNLVWPVLEAALIKKVVADYDGSGDSGQLNSVVVFGADDENRTLPTTQITIGVYETYDASGDPVEKEVRLDEYLGDLAWDFVMINHEGFYNNEGGQGEVIFDVAERKVKNIHSNFYTASTDYEHEFG